MRVALGAAWLLLVAGVAAAVTDSVMVLSPFKQAVTSSILRWVSVEPGQPLPEHAVLGAVELRDAAPAADDVDDDATTPADRKEPARAYVCRLRREGMWLSGETRVEPSSGAERAGPCVVSMHGLIYRENSYEVLDNAVDGARLSWVRWDKYSRVPAGAVTGDDVNYVARRAVQPPASFSHRLGRLEPDLGLGRLTVVTDDGAADFEDGEVLVETEPVGYEMSEVRFNRWRKKFVRTPVQLGQKMLSNDDDPSEGVVSRVDSVIAYSYNYSLSWGHGQAVITGLPVSVRLANGTELDGFKWGIDEARERQATYQVEARLPPGASTNVRLLGNLTEALLPYTAQLTAVYADGERRARPISGSRRELAMWDVRPEFEAARFTANGTLVPTTTSTTSTTTSTTSSTTSTTTGRSTTDGSTAPPPLPAPPSPMEKQPKKGGERPAKGENSAMQSDEGRRAAATSSAAAARFLLALALLVALPLGT